MKELLDSLRIVDGQRTEVTQRRAAVPAKSRRRYWLAALLPLPLGAVGWYVTSASAISVELATAAAAAGAAVPAVVLSAGGYVKAARTVQVVPRVSGRIVTMSVEEGDVVAAGDVIATIDSRDLEQDVVEAKAAMDMASANLARQKAGSRPQEISAARARYEAAVAQVDLAARELARSQSLASTGAIAKQTIERAETDHRVRASAAESARQLLALVEAGPPVEDIRAAEAALAVARAKWTRATQRLSDARVTAPIAGRVVRKLREEGDFVSAEAPFIEGAETLAVGSPLVTLADPGPQQATVDINETDIAKVSLGQHVQIVPAAYPSLALAGRVTRLAARADRNKGTLQVRVTLEKSETVLPEDLSVKLSFLAIASVSGGRPGSVLIPARALLEKDGRPFVYVPAGGRAQRRDVDVGAKSQEGMLVTHGLSAGERVIVSDLDHLEDGKRIKAR